MLTPDSESVLDRLERRGSRAKPDTWISVRNDHWRALLDVARAAERSATIFPGKPGYGEARVELRRVLKSLTTPSEQKEET